MRDLSAAIKSELFSTSGTLEVDSFIEIIFGPNVRRYHLIGGDPVPLKGVLWATRPHAITIPDDRADIILEMDMVIDNSDNALTDFAILQTSKGEVNQEYRFNSTGRELILGPYQYDIIRCDIDDSRGNLVFGLSFDRALTEPFPSEIYSPSRYPGLF